MNTRPVEGDARLRLVEIGNEGAGGTGRTKSTFYVLEWQSNACHRRFRPKATNSQIAH